MEKKPLLTFDRLLVPLQIVFGLKILQVFIISFVSETVIVNCMRYEIQCLCWYPYDQPR